MRNLITPLFITCFTINCFSASKKLFVPGDYPNIQQAINAAEHGDIVEIQPGTYRETLTFKNGIHLKGTDINEVLISCDANVGSVITVKDCPSGIISELTLSQTRADKLPSGEQSLFPILHIDASSIKVIQCTLRDGGDNGITIEGKGKCEILECSIYKNKRSGIFVLHEGAEPLLRNNRCSENSINGIYFQEGAAGLAEGNMCYKNSYNGICVIHDWTSPTLKSNQCFQNKASGIYWGDKAKGLAEENICKENEWHGIAVADKSAAPSLKNNICSDNKRCGIYYPTRTNATAKGNILKNNGEVNRRQLRKLLWNKRFDELEEIASRLRTDKSNFTNGNSQLAWFYHCLANTWAGLRPPQEEWLFDTLESWIGQKPRSITPRVVMAKAYVCFSWAARGSDWASDVPEDSWEVFYEKLKKAWKSLLEAEKLREKDPELYRVFIAAGMGLNKPKKEIYNLLKKGVKIDKDYYPLYLQMANYLLPRWHGGPGELAEFAKDSAESNKTEGEILYARIVAATVPKYHNVGMEDFLDLGFSYDYAKQGHIQLLSMYPEASYYLNSYCLLSSVYGDKKTAKQLFHDIGVNWDKMIWVKEVHFNKYKELANSSTDYQKRTAPQKKEETYFKRFLRKMFEKDLYKSKHNEALNK